MTSWGTSIKPDIHTTHTRRREVRAIAVRIGVSGKRMDFSVSVRKLRLFYALIFVAWLSVEISAPSAA